MKKRHKNCCEKIRRKGRFCKDCPLAAMLEKKQRKKLIKKFAKRAA